MAISIPTTAEQAAANLVRIETQLNQTTPSNNKSFNSVIAAMEAAQFTTLYKFAVDRAKQNLAITATGEDLKNLARNYGVEPKGSTSAVITFTLPAITGVVILSSVDFVGDSNGVRYSPDSDNTSVASVVTVTATSQISGTASNLEINDTLTIGTQVAGAESTATITVIDSVAVDEETDDALRVRILDKIRTEGGGANSSDYRNWAQETPGVFRAYPYAGNPTYLEDGTGSTFPGERTIYIQSDTTIDPDGIPPASLLDDARGYIRFNPDDNNRAREPLPLGDATLFVEAIIITEFFVDIVNLSVSADIESQVKSDIESSISAYFANVSPYIVGLDVESGKNNVITAMSLAQTVQDVVSSAGGTFVSISFDIGGTALSSYTVAVHELTKLAAGGITYV